MKGLHIRWGMNIRRAPKRPYGMMAEIQALLNEYLSLVGAAASAPCLTEAGHEWNRLDRERHALEMLQRDAALSWREEIVNESVREDESREQ